MAAASNQQVQVYSDTTVRPLCEQIRALYLNCKTAKAALNDVYANLTNSPTWTDGRSDNPPHLATPNDMLAWNAFVSALITMIEGSEASDFGVIESLCVRPTVL